MDVICSMISLLELYFGFKVTCAFCLQHQAKLCTQLLLVKLFHRPRVFIYSNTSMFIYLITFQLIIGYQLVLFKLVAVA